MPEMRPELHNGRVHLREQAALPLKQAEEGSDF